MEIGGMNMKTKIFLCASLYSTMVLFAMTGCSDEDIVKQENNRPQGNGIVFGASAGYVGEADSRTAYGDYNDPDNPTSQEILWVDKDRVEVYSPTSPTKKQVEYEVTNLDANDEGKAYLTSYQGQDGLQWDFSSATQHFYAVYPSSASIKNQEMVTAHNIRFENGTLYGFIPINQEYSFTKDENANGGWKCEPTMDWQYMVARCTDFKVPTDGSDGGINLDFHPLVTTLEITLVGPSAPLAQMNIDAPEGTKIMGEFSCNVGGDWNDGGLPDCTLVPSISTEENRVTINLYDTAGQPITLAGGEYLTINVFLLPVENLTDLEVRLAGYNTASRTLQLDDKGTAITLTPHMKTRVKIQAPDHITGTNQWMSGLSNNVYVSQLSIPGTANSFSYEYDGDNPEWYAAQTVEFEKQWDAGIRCFELKCPHTSGDLGDVILQCNRTNLGTTTFKQAVDMIWNKVKDSKEFAMIIPAYESTAGHGGDAVRQFANALNTFYRNNENNYKFVTYGRDITLGEARGSLMFVARITSEEDENSIDDIAPEQGVIIKGWGSLKDLWARRGYNAPNWADNNNDFQGSIEYDMINGNRSENYSFTMPEAGENNFMHNTIRKGGSTGTAYVQDWNRVSKESKNYKLYDSYHNVGNWWSDWQIEYTQYAYWPESFEEKCNDVWNTFMAAIDDNNNKQGSTFYINSLDGFYVDVNIPLSYTPYISSRGDSYINSSGRRVEFSYTSGGTAGNIADFAKDINDDFFQRIQNYGPTNIYGPMNVVLLDRVYQNADGSDSGSRLPSTIINNNFRFPLLIKESAGEGGN